MKGTLQKKVEPCSFLCSPCLHFRDDDPDIFYCSYQKEEFPNLCKDYQQSATISDARNEWGSLNEQL